MGLNNPQIKAILCLDIDGTLLDSNEQVHPNDVRILQHFPPEVQIILNTGRPLHSAKPILHKNGIFQGKKLPVPAICMNGGVAYLPGEDLCLENPLDQTVCQKLYDLSKTHPQTEFMFFTISEVYQANQTAFGDQIAERHYLNTVGKVREEVLEKIIKVMTLNEDLQILKQIRSETKRLQAQMSFSLPFIFEFNRPDITKASTLLQLVGKLGLDGLPIFSAGDGENDLPMFRIAKDSFAPDTAHPKVIENASHIISRNKNGLLEPILEVIYLSINQ